MFAATAPFDVCFRRKIYGIIMSTNSAKGYYALQANGLLEIGNFKIVFPV